MIRMLLTETKINLFLALLDQIDSLTKEEGEILALLSMDPEVMEVLDRRPKDRFIVLASRGFLDENQNLDTEVF